MPQQSLSETLDDPQFRQLSPDAQKIVLNKHGVSPDMQTKLLQHVSTIPLPPPSMAGQVHATPSKNLIPPGSGVAESKSLPSAPWTPTGLIPPIASAVGAGLGTAAAGPVGGFEGATLGGAAGEAARQLIQRARGKQTPATSQEAGQQIMGEAASGGASELIGQGASRVFKPLAEGLSKTAARGSKIPLLPSEAGVGGAATKTVEGFVAHALPSRGVMDAFREKQLAAATQVATDEIGKLSAFRGTPEEAGKLYQQALDQGRARLKEEVNGAYKAIDDLTASQTKRVGQQIEVPSSMVDEFGRPMTYQKRILKKVDVGGVQPETREIKKTAIGLLREIKQQEKLMDPKLLADTKSTLESIVNAPDQVPYSAMARSRSDLLALTRKLDEALPGKRAGTAKLLAKQMDNSLTEAAEKSGISGLPDQVRIANSMTKEMHRKFEQDLVTKIIDSKNHALLTGYVQKAGLQELRDVNAIITPAQQKVMRHQVAEQTLAGSFDDVTHQLDPQKFARGINQLGDERGRLIFKESWDSIKQLSNMVGKVGSTKGGGSGASLHNIHYFVSMGGAMMAIATGHVGTAGAIAGADATEAGLLRGIARALTNPAKAAKVVNYVRLGAHGAPYAIYGLTKIAESEQDEAPPPPPKAQP